MLSVFQGLSYGALTWNTSVTSRDEGTGNSKHLTGRHGHIETLRDGCTGAGQDVEHCLMTSLNRQNGRSSF